MSDERKSALLAKELFYKKKNVFSDKSAEERDAMMAFAEDYKAWLDLSKTEREAVTEMEKILADAGFRPYDCQLYC